MLFRSYNSGIVNAGAYATANNNNDQALYYYNLIQWAAFPNYRSTQLAPILNGQHIYQFYDSNTIAATIDTIATLKNIRNISTASGLVVSIISISSSQTLGNTANTEYVYLVNGLTTVTLPSAASNTNIYHIKRIGTSTITLNTTGGATIDGVASKNINGQYQSYTLVSDGTNWFIL